MESNHIQKFFNLSSSSYDFFTNLFSVAAKNNDVAMQIILNKIDLKNLKVLDIGCGTGIWSSYFHNHGAIVHGIDFASNMIKVAKKKFGDSINFEVLSAFDIIKYDKNDFDIITAAYVFHDINPKDRIELLKRIKQICKKWLIVHDYGGNIPTIPKIIESFEKSSYIDFIKNFDNEIINIFGNNYEKYSLKKGGALFIISV